MSFNNDEPLPPKAASQQSPTPDEHDLIALFGYVSYRSAVFSKADREPLRSRLAVHERPYAAVIRGLRLQPPSQFTRAEVLVGRPCIVLGDKVSHLQFTRAEVLVGRPCIVLGDKVSHLMLIEQGRRFAPEIITLDHFISALSNDWCVSIFEL
jgi:hypothetical protein